MVRAVVVGMLGILLIGCGATPVKLRTETVEVVRPVLYCPAPNYQELNRPNSLPTDAITATTSQGEIAVRYKATIKELQLYIKRLELTIQQYDNTSIALDELRARLGLDKPQQ